MSSSLFEETWWLDAVAPESWIGVEVGSQGGPAGSMRVVRSRESLGFVRLGNAPLLPRVGLTLSPGEGKPTTRLSRTDVLVRQLVERLPKYDYLTLMFGPSFGNWLPFHWLGFSQTTRYSYVLDPVAQPEILWAGMAEPRRRAIRKAERMLTVRPVEVVALQALTSETFTRQGMPNPFSRALLARAVAAATARERGLLLGAVDGEAQPHAAALFVWDANRVYYLVGGSRIDTEAGSGMSLLLWHGMRIACEKGLTFDFEGSMIHPIERFFRSFGGRPEPYLHVTHMSRRLAAAVAMRNVWNAITERRRFHENSAAAYPNDQGGETEK